ncbi:hypothetical protein [Bacillus sp. FJAT-29937]|uniref:hypothetical protein n=1 Tax=Bacillus sp. FJAT-29937 TaxID=1720553 RepID=UPI00082D9F23|nr:hypothetical protein [Bacillus sp. FJAT-29937]
MNLEKYPRTKELIQEVNLEDRIDRIQWLQLDKEEAATALAKTYLVSVLSMSSNPFTKEKAKRLTDQLYFSVGYQLHGFAKEEGNAQLGYANSDVTRIFKHIAFGGYRFQ